MADPSSTDQGKRPVSNAPDPARATALLEALPSAAALFRRSGMLYAINTLGRAWFVVDADAPLSSQLWSVVLRPLQGAGSALLARAAAGEAPDTQRVLLIDEARVVDVRAVPFDDALLLLTATEVATPEAVVTAGDEPRRESVRVGRELSALLSITPSAVRIADVAGRILQSNAIASLEHPARQPSTVRELWACDAPRDLAHDRPLSFPESPAMRALAGHVVHGQRLAVRRFAERGHTERGLTERGLTEPRVIESFASPIRNARQEVVGVVLLDRDVCDHDVCDHARLEAEWQERRTHERAHEHERVLTAVGQLAAGVMHEVNNALNPIMAAAYLLRHYADSPDAVRDYADRIQQAAEIGAATASRLGRFIRQEPVHAGGDEAIDLSVLAGEVLDVAAPLRPRQSDATGAVVLVRQFAPHVYTRGLPDDLREALRHLVQNAVDAMPEGGTLTVRTFEDDAHACLAMRDTGVGMSAAVQERAFEPFFTTKGAEGVGLGLAEVYGIARRHGGTATLAAVPGRGTEVTLRLPRAVEVATDRAIPAAAPDAVVPKHILVVEDHDDGREFLRRILQADGHRVDAVATCHDARERLVACADTPYDVLLTDLRLPDGSGWDLVRDVRRSMPGVRVGVITGWESTADAGESHGVDFVLHKPLHAAELQAHLAGRFAPASTTG